VNEHGPGEWPVNKPADLDAANDPDEVYVRLASERARREIVLASIRAHLEEQPTPGSVHKAARTWCAEITGIGDEVAKTKRSTS
jgi:hypothetical protein